MTVQIVDLSHYNGDVDFVKLKAFGIDAVIHKATEGLHYIDPRYVERRAQAKAAGMPWGAYHFLDPRVSGAAQAAFFLKVIGPHGYELRPALDHETRGKTVAATAACAVAFDRAMDHALGYEEIVYTYDAFARAGYCSGLGKEPLWYARYIPGADWSDIAKRVPPPWDSSRMVLWQAGQKHVSGASAGDGPGVDFDEAPSLTPLLVPKPGASKVLPRPSGHPWAKLSAYAANGVVLRNPSHGYAVMAVQDRLSLHIDGKFGPKTEDSVKRFQRCHGLTADGVVGAKTWAALASSD